MTYQHFFRSEILVHISVFALFLSGCATAPQIGKGMSPQALFSYACAPGKNIASAKGTVWIKVDSKEISGQFLANTSVSHSEQLKLEIVNFLGGTEALVSIGQGRFEVIGPDASDVQNRTADGYWGGVPLRWAPRLFLGKIPCPSADEKLKLSVDSNGELEIIAPQEGKKKSDRFIFGFREVNGSPWPYHLRWEKVEDGKALDQNSTLNSVDFKFDDPEDGSLSPTRWEAHSSLGTVKIRWRKREVSS